MLHTGNIVKSTILIQIFAFMLLNPHQTWSSNWNHIHNTSKNGRLRRLDLGLLGHRLIPQPHERPLDLSRSDVGTFHVLSPGRLMKLSNRQRRGDSRPICSQPPSKDTTNHGNTRLFGLLELSQSWGRLFISRLERFWEEEFPFWTFLFFVCSQASRQRSQTLQILTHRSQSTQCIGPKLQHCSTQGRDVDKEIFLQSLFKINNAYIPIVQKI